MKPYLLIDDYITATNKGTLKGKVYSRFIATADSVFRLLQRAYSGRPEMPNCKFYIYDKNPRHIEMFKHMMSWDGDFASFFGHIKAGEGNIGITCKEYDQYQFEKNTQLGRIMRHDYKLLSFKECWQQFQNSDFEFIDIDIIEENEKFVNFLETLEPLDKAKKQYTYLGINPANYTKEKYTESMNNILHLLWMKSFRQFTTKIDTVDAENKPYEKYAGEIYAAMNSTFCILPWMHVQYKPSGQSKLCCRYDTVSELKKYTKFEKNNQLDNIEFKKDNTDHEILALVPERLNLTIQQTSIENTFESDYWNTARKNTITNKEITGCRKCYLEEKIESSDSDVPISMRLGSSILYNNGFLHKKPKYETPKLEFLEVGFGNYCNLACLTCNSTLSTTWHADEVLLNKSLVDSRHKENLSRSVFPKLDNLKFKLEDKHLATLKIIKFTGGEPMINPEFVKFIDQIVDRGRPENITLEIYTNCSYVPSPKLLENLTKFKTVQLNLSIDASGELNDYIRYGSRWVGDTKQTVSNALDFWISVTKEHKNIPLIMSTTLSILNVLEIPKLMSWWVNKLIDNNVDIKFVRESSEFSNGHVAHHIGFFKLQPVFDPAYLDISILPAKYYSEVSNWIVHFKQNFSTLYPTLPDIPESILFSLRKLEQLIHKSEGNLERVNLFLEYTNKMDTIRKNSIKNYLPILLEKIDLFKQENRS